MKIFFPYIFWKYKNGLTSNVQIEHERYLLILTILCKWLNEYEIWWILLRKFLKISWICFNILTIRQSKWKCILCQALSALGSATQAGRLSTIDQIISIIDCELGSSFDFHASEKGNGGKTFVVIDIHKLCKQVWIAWMLKVEKLELLTNNFLMHLK